jgi:hypothetical protein
MSTRATLNAIVCPKHSSKLYELVAGVEHDAILLGSDVHNIRVENHGNEVQIEINNVATSDQVTVDSWPITSFKDFEKMVHGMRGVDQDLPVYVHLKSAASCNVHLMAE